MTEAADRHVLLEALSKVHKFSPPRAVQPETDRDHAPAWGSAGAPGVRPRPSRWRGFFSRFSGGAYRW